MLHANEILPVEWIVELFSRAIFCNPTRKAFILDNFPCTPGQVKKKWEAPWGFNLFSPLFFPLFFPFFF